MSTDSISTKLQDLFDLFNSGALSQEEYSLLKSEILNAGNTSNAKPKESKSQPNRQSEASTQPNLQNEVRKVVFEDKLKADPLNVALLHEYAQFLFENNYFEASVAAYLKILALNENDAVAQDLLFSLYKKLNWNKDVLQAGEKLLLRKPDDISLLEELAKISSQLGHIDKASEYYDRILKLQPQNQNALYNKGLNHISNNQHEAAIEIFKNLYAGGLTDRITTIYAGIDKTINGDYKGAILLLKPVLSNGKQVGINDNRAMLYLTFCLCESLVNLDEIKHKFSTIDFNILKEKYQPIDEQTAVKITEYIFIQKLSTINSKDITETQLEQLADSFLNLEYFTENSNPNIAELWFALGCKQSELKLSEKALMSILKAQNLMPDDLRYKNKYVEIENIAIARSRKKTKNRIIAIVSVFVLIITIAASIYAYPYFKEGIAFHHAKHENTSSSYQVFLDKYPEGSYVSEVKELQEKEMFQFVKRINTIDYYQHFYLDRYPEGSYVSEVKELIERERKIADSIEIVKSISMSETKRIADSILQHNQNINSSISGAANEQEGGNQRNTSTDERDSRRKDVANVYWNPDYSLFCLLTDEPIFPQNGVYDIWYSSNEDPSPNHGLFSISELQSLLYYKFKDYETCKKWCDMRKH